MKKNVTEIIKVIIGTLIGTVIVVFVMWFLWGGGEVLFLPPWITIPILILLFPLSVIVVGRMIHYKYILSVIASFIFGVFGFNALYKHTCGPNSADVKVMKPMAEAISQYVIKHGIPESLKDIPNLPFGLVGCERSEEYLISHNGGMHFASEKEAELYNYREECHFKNIELSYWLQKDLHHKNQVTISLKMVSTNRTVYDTGLAINKNNRFINLDTDIRSYKNTGICNPMKQ